MRRLLRTFSRGVLSPGVTSFLKCYHVNVDQNREFLFNYQNIASNRDLSLNRVNCRSHLIQRSFVMSPRTPNYRNAFFEIRNGKRRRIIFTVVVICISCIFVTLCVVLFIYQRNRKKAQQLTTDYMVNKIENSSRSELVQKIILALEKNNDDDPLQHVHLSEMFNKHYTKNEENKEVVVSLARKFIQDNRDELAESLENIIVEYLGQNLNSPIIGELKKTLLHFSGASQRTLRNEEGVERGERESLNLYAQQRFIDRMNNSVKDKLLQVVLRRKKKNEGKTGKE